MSPFLNTCVWIQNPSSVKLLTFFLKLKQKISTGKKEIYARDKIREYTSPAWRNRQALRQMLASERTAEEGSNTFSSTFKTTVHLTTEKSAGRHIVLMWNEIFKKPSGPCPFYSQRQP